ncbi:MAG: cation:dicarboxylase symporter family transporter, partial [Gammaproteobacteria bacterium]|nr:cation:dicarboxylase symporter family transporter [Gammaproteobacteria bacterium]
MAPTDRQLANRILVGLVAGALAGALVLALAEFWPPLHDGARVFASQVLDPLGQIFLRLLFFVVVPLVFASLALGVAQLGELARIGPLAARTFALFLCNMAIAVALGLLMMNLLRPGAALDAATRERL